MSVTIKDIAMKSGVSTATISNVLTGKKYVSKEIKDRVNKVIEEMGYQTNTYARGLKTNRSYTLGVQIPDIENPYFSKAVRVFQRRAEEVGYNIILYNTGNEPEIERKNLCNMCGMKVDGIISVAPRLPIPQLVDNVDVPIVVVDRLPVETNRNIAFVYADNYGGGTNIARYAIEKGYTYFIMLGGPTHLVSNATERIRGISETLKQAGVPEEQCRILYGEFSFDCGYSLMKQCLLDSVPNDGKTVVIGGSDIMAWGAMEAIKDFGLKIPRDIAVIGYDNIDFSRFLYPSLTTMENPIEQMSNLASDQILGAAIEGKRLNNIRIVVAGGFLARNSA